MKIRDQHWLQYLLLLGLNEVQFMFYILIDSYEEASNNMHKVKQILFFNDESSFGDVATIQEFTDILVLNEARLVDLTAYELD